MPISAAPTEAPVEAPRRRPWGRIWALGDQVLVSAANFITMVMTARALHPAEFGMFTQAYAILLLANIFQWAIVVQAHNVLGATRTGKAYAAYTTATGLSQLVLCAIQAALISVVAVVATSAGYSWAGLAWALVPAVCAWQLQEFIRRVLYTEGRHFAAFANDCISYGGQGIVIFWLWHRGTLHDTTALYVLAETSFVAALIGIWQMRASLTRSIDRSAFRENWLFGRWLLGGELLQYASSIQTYLFIAAYLLGASAAGELRAAQIVFGPTRIFSFYLGNVLPTRFSRALATEGDRATKASFLKVMRQVVPPFAVYSLTIAVLAEPILRLMYGAEFAGQPWVLRAYAFVALLSYIQVLFVSLLTAHRKTRAIFVGQVAGGAVGLAVGWIAILLIGIAGAPLAIGISTVITMMFLHSRVREGDQQPVSAESTAAPASTPLVENNTNGSPEAAALQARRAALLVTILADLDRANIRYCITHGHGALPDQISGDVDCVIDDSVDRATLARVLRGSALLGRRIVQWLDDGAQYIVFADADERSPATVALHLSTDYEADGRIVFMGRELLETRIRRGALWVTPPGAEAACIIANRITKQNLRPRDQQRLSALFEQDRSACTAAAKSLLGEASGNLLVTAACNDDWTAVLGQMPQFRRDLRAKLKSPGLGTVVTAKAADQLRRLSRWLRPRNGFHVVFLGPDGVGKSTVIEEVRDAIRPAFLHYSYQTFAPSLLPAKYTEKPSPHAKPPRSVPESLLKAAWWSFCYGPLYLVAVHPTRARAGLVINHRYLLDAIVDTKRYRYSGPTWLLKMIWAISPKPDLVILLDAPADVIQARKKEMPFEETARQCAAYRALVGSLSNGVMIDAGRPLDEVVASVNTTIFTMLERRTAKQC